MATYKTMDEVLREEAVKLIVLERKARMLPREALLEELRVIADHLDDWCFHSPECGNGDKCIAGEEGGNERRVRESNEQVAAEIASEDAALAEVATTLADARCLEHRNRPDGRDYRCALATGHTGGHISPEELEALRGTTLDEMTTALAAGKV
ncbi:MAG TPA: hypothetical protein PK948_06600 [Gemmatimonadales bacterium]|nr:hypothetical protein [Gemmatimonadales bacterium]